MLNQEKMNIIHVTDYFEPQLGYQETFLAREHAKMGHNVIVVTSDRYEPRIYKANKDLLKSRGQKSGFYIEEGIKVWRLKTLFELPHAIWMRSLEKKILELEPDIVIVHRIIKFETIRIAALKNKGADFKLICDDHMTFDNSRSPLRLLYPLFRWTFSRGIQKAANAIVAVGEPSQRFMHKRYGIPTDRITVISMGADSDLFRFDIDARRDIRNMLGIAESNLMLIYTGKIVPSKKLEILVDAVKHLANIDNLIVLLLGNGPDYYTKQLREYIQIRNLSSKFIWHDTVHNNSLYKYYSAADIAVWPYGASISQLEAMSCGLPIIFSDNGNINEMTYVDNQIKYEKEDPASLALTINILLNPMKRHNIGTDGRKIIEEKLNWRAIAQQFLELVEK